MNFGLLFQQFVGYAIASAVTWAASRYHLTTEQQGLLTTDIMGIAAGAGALLYGLWTTHRAYLATPPSAPPPPKPVRPLQEQNK